MALRAFIAFTAASVAAQIGRQLSPPGGLGGKWPPNWLGRLAAAALRIAAGVVRAAAPVLVPIRNSLSRWARVGVRAGVFALRTIADMVMIVVGFGALVVGVLGGVLRLVLSRLPHPRRHIPRSDLEVAVLAGSISIGLLVGAAFAVQALMSSPSPGRVAASAAEIEAPLPTATPIPEVKPISEVPLRTRVLPRLKIPELKVDAPLEPVGLIKGGAMGIPTDGETVAWYSLGPFPGSPGNAVLAGHVDWARRAAVFNRLKELAPGSRLSLDFDLGAELDFRVTWVEQYRVQAAPLARVFDNNTGSALTLITCGGPFDSNTRTYLDRVVVRAVRA